MLREGVPEVPMSIHSEQQQPQAISNQQQRLQRQAVRLHPALLISLILLAIVLILVGIFGFRFIEGKMLGAIQDTPKVSPSMTSSPGSSQSNKYTQYKQLATLYV